MVILHQSCCRRRYQSGPPFWLPSYPVRADRTTFAKIRSMDWLGTALITGIYTTFILAFTFAGSQWSCDSYRFAIIMAFFGICVVAFIVTQYFAVLTTKEQRLFPGQFLRSRTLILIFCTTSATITSMLVGIYYIPLIFQFARDDSAIMAAVRLLPFVCLMIAFILLNGALMPVLGYYMPWFVFGGTFQIIGGSLMYTISPETSTSTIYGYSVLLGIGCGVTMQSGYSIIAAKVKPQEVPAAIGFNNLAQIGGRGRPCTDDRRHCLPESGLQQT